MKILALCDSITQALRFYSGLGSIDGINLEFLICNNSQRSSLLFTASQLRQALHSWQCAWRLFRLKACRFSNKPVHDAAVLAWLRTQRYDIGLHGMGVIYRQPLISCFNRGILNAHIGKLPDYRGRSVMEWSILHGSPTGVSTFFIDSGIDTGSPIVHWESFYVGHMNSIATAKQFLFDQDVRQYRAALLSLLMNPDHGWPNETDMGRRHYVMSKLLLSVIEKKIGAD